MSWNVRSFPTGTRNCYTLSPRSGKNNRYLIRATFLYGNYDGEGRAPKFDLYIGVDRWRIIEYFSNYFFLDIIHVPSTDYIHVCLVNTGYGTPFISALELRLLDKSIYQIGSGALSLVNRFDIGPSSAGTTRYYPDDVYDRIWESFDPKTLPNWLAINTTFHIESGSNNAYKVPDKVLTTAARSRNPGITLSTFWNRTMSSSRQHYLYFHFAEIEELESGQQRQIEIAVNNEFKKIIKLEYLKPVTVNSSLISGEFITYNISSTEGSAFPPILNAVELFELIELSYLSTAPEDVDAILKIKKAYQVITKNWQGDPCVPINYSWDGLNCSDNNPRRIISLNLSSSNLTGEIDGSLFYLKKIETLDLSYNGLTGTLPEFLAKMPNLKILNLNGNNLTGSVPQSLKLKSTEGSLHLSLDENPDLCLKTSCKEKRKKKFVVPVVASAVSVLLLILILLSAHAIFKQIKKRRQGGRVITSKDMKSKSQQFSYSTVVKITNNFQTVLGEGGFGKVFLGGLQDGTQVAVKMLSPLSKQGFKEFRSEVQLLMIVHHRNLVSLIGYCDENRNMALIYEYMDNGNLEQHLTAGFVFAEESNILSWNERLQIAVDAAQGLEYLHNGCKPPVIHRDLKTSNILLDKNMRAKIADFGLSRVFGTENDTHVSTMPCGTSGYLDPEFQSSGHLNKKSDVYSFGIVLFGLITGRPAITRGPANQSFHILQWVIPRIERADIENIVDPILKGEFNYNSAWKIVEIALSCIPSTAIHRPDISCVLSELKDCLTMEMNTEITQRTRSFDSRPINSLETELELSPTAR